MKRPRIDISSVVCLSSSNFGDVILPSSGCKRAIPAMPFACAGPWMAQAMAHSIPSLAKQHDSTSTTSAAGWEVVNDPDLGLLVLSPSKIPFHNGIQLKNALGFTSVAQLITLSTPPFCVVHANKAFSMFSGLSNGVVIGEAVESILQVVQDIPAEPSCTTRKTIRSLGARIVSSNKPCQLLVIPITDRFCNPQGGMSHLLVKIEPSEGQGITVDGTRAKTLRKALGVRGNRLVLGTVG